MKKTLLIAFLAFFAFTNGNAQSRKERKAMYDSKYNYEIQSLGVGQDGTKLVKIWGYGKRRTMPFMKPKETPSPLLFSEVFRQAMARQPHLPFSRLTAMKKMQIFLMISLKPAGCT